MVRVVVVFSLERADYSDDQKCHFVTNSHISRVWPCLEVAVVGSVLGLGDPSQVCGFPDLSRLMYIC